MTRCFQRAELLFVVIAAFFGVLFCFVTPPLGVPDEHTHFYRAYAITNGDLLEIKLSNGMLGNVLPRSIQEIGTHYYNVSHHLGAVASVPELLKRLNTPLKPDEVTEVPFPTGAAYAPTAFLPQIAGIGLAKLIRPTTLGTIYGARLASLIFWIALVAISIYRLPKRAQFLAAIVALTPMALSQAASASPDAMNNALSFYVISCFIAWASLPEGRTIRNHDLLVYFIASILLMTCKQIYIVCAFLIVFIAPRKFGGRGLKYVYIAALFAAVVGVELAWGKFVAQPLPASKIENVNWLKHSPLQFMLMLLQTSAYMFKTYLGEYIGIFGYRDIKMPVFVYPIYLFALALAMCSTRLRIDWRARAMALAIIVFEYVLIHVAMYVDWIGVKDGIIRGVQGRYFLPLAALLLFFAARYIRSDWRILGFQPKIRLIRYVATACCCLFLMISIARMVQVWTF